MIEQVLGAELLPVPTDVEVAEDVDIDRAREYAEAVRKHTYRPPVSGHLIDNSAIGGPDVMLGPGPLGAFARAVAPWIAVAISTWMWLA